MTALDRVIAFDARTGVLRAEAGITLSDVLRIAVHGATSSRHAGHALRDPGAAPSRTMCMARNHHTAGTIGNSVRRLGLHRSDAGAIELSPDVNAELFRATIAGLGLTGLIAWVELQLDPIRSAFLSTETIPFSGYAEFNDLARVAYRPGSIRSPGSTARPAPMKRACADCSRARTGSRTATFHTR